MDVDICSSCKQPFKKLYYQRRAADEPPDILDYCDHCLVDTRKLDVFSRPEPYPSEKLVKITRLDRQKSVSLPKPATNLGTDALLFVEGNAARRCLDRLRSEEASSTKLQSMTVPIQWGSGQELVEFYKGSDMGSEGFIVTDSRNIAPYVKLKSVTKFKLRGSGGYKYPTYMSGLEYILKDTPFSRSSVLRLIEENNSCVIIIALVEASGEAVMKVLSHVLTEYGTEESIRSFMDPSVVSSMYTQSSKAYDWPSAPRKNYAFTWKPDGERFWCLRYGSVWFFSRRLLSGKIAGWVLEKEVKVASNVGPVLDIEVLINHDPILIDILVREDGRVTPPTRSLRMVKDMFNEMRDECIPIHLRSYLRSEELLFKPKNKPTYPVDGVVGVEAKTMTIVKLKSTKSIELKLLDDGELITVEGKIMARTSLHNKYTPGSIIELRITMNGGNGKISVDQALLRTDKTKANSYDVCKNVIHTMTSAPDALERKNALIWCNTVRQRVHKMASTINSGGKIVVVIGAGDGQEVGDYSKDGGTSYMLIEPSEEKCRKLRDRLRTSDSNSPNNVKLVTGAANFSSAMSTLMSSTVKFIVLNSTIGDVIGNRSSIRSMEMSAKCCVAPFSISHVSKDIIYLARHGIDVVGCGYLYDNIDENGVLVDEAGVLMKCVGDGKSVVKWGSDTTFEEASITKGLFELDMTVTPAAKTVPVFKKGNHTLLNTLCDNVYIIRTAGFRV